MKIGFKMSFFDTRMGYYKFWELKKKIWDEKKKIKKCFQNSLYTVKRGFKMDFLVRSESNRRSFRTPTFFFEIFVKKFTFWGGGGQRQFGKSLHFDFFFLHPSLTIYYLVHMWLDGLGQAKGLPLVARHGGLLSRLTGFYLSVSMYHSHNIFIYPFCYRNTTG